MRNLFLCILFLTAALPAQTTPEERPRAPLSLRKALELATSPEGSARVQLAEELVRASETRVQQTRAALLPNVDGSFNYRNFTQNLRTFGITIPASFPGFVFPALVGPIDALDLRASATQSILDLSAIKRYQASKAQVGVTRREKDVSRTQTEAQVGRAYAEAQRAEAVLDTAKANVQLAERLLQLARSQKEAGTGTGIEVTRAEVQLASRQHAELIAANQREAARLQLLRAMGLNLDMDFALTDVLTYKPAEILDESAAVAEAMRMRPEVLAQQERGSVARINYDATKLERVPSINAFGDYGVLGVSPTEMLPTRAVGASLRIPIWDGGRRDARRAESAIQMRMEDIRLRDTRLQVDMEVRLALDALRSADRQALVALQQVRLTEKELEQAERRYEAGIATNLEVTDAQTRLSAAREANVSALYRLALARIDTGVAIGSLDRFLQ